jgi:2,5-diketo-D-gluconate reductase A
MNPPIPQKTYEETLETIQRHLKRLQTSYIDLFLLHHAYPRQERINQYRGLLEAQKQGWVREVGVSNWNIAHIEEIKSAGLPLPAVNQIEIHPLANQQQLVEYCQAHGIVIVAYSSLAPLASWRESTDRQRAAKKATDVTADGVERLNTYLTQLCEQRFPGKTPSQILLRWALQHSFPILPKSAQEKRIIENGELFDESFVLSSEEMQELDHAFNEDRTFAWPSGNPLLAE